MEVDSGALRRVRTHLTRFGDLWKKTDEEDSSEATPGIPPQSPPRHHSSPLQVFRRFQRRGSGGESETDEEQRPKRKTAAGCFLESVRLQHDGVGPSNSSAVSPEDRRRYSGGEDAENEGDESDVAVLEGRRWRRKRSRKSFCARRALTISEGCSTAAANASVGLERALPPLHLASKDCSLTEEGDDTVPPWDGPSLDSGGIFEKWSQRLKQRSGQVHRYFQRNTKLSDVNRRLKSQIWSSVVTIVLIEGKNLVAMDMDGLSDPYVKFRCGRGIRSQILHLSRAG